MRLLVIGGTRFVGRHLVEAALAAGHSVTLFNRGQTDPELFAHVERVRGDRDGDLGLLEGRTWDAVIDTCGYLPRVVRSSARLLAKAAPHYTFISSVSVYPDDATPGQDERAPVGTLEDPTVEEITDETYGPLKAMCEREVERAFPSRALIVRCGLIVGPHDYTDRFTYWVARVAAGGEVLAPQPTGWQVQFIDARDLAGWILRSIDDSEDGVFNATGPDRVVTMAEFLEACRRVGGSNAKVTWVDERFLIDRGVEPWSDLPMWLPAENAGTLSVDVGRAVRAGLTFRPLEATIGDTLEWHRSRPSDHTMRAGLPADREAELLRRWHEASLDDS